MLRHNFSIKVFAVWRIIAIFAAEEIIKLILKIISIMAKIQDKNFYDAAMARIEELLPLVNDDTPKTDKNLIELDLLSELVSEYEDEHYPIKSPSLIECGS